MQQIYYGCLRGLNVDTVYQPCECVAAINNKEQNSAEAKSIAVPRFMVFLILLATNNNRQKHCCEGK